MRLREVKFQGKDYIFLGELEGPIATKEQYQNGKCSYAYLFSDGIVRRFNQAIGRRQDIKFGKDIELSLLVSLPEMFDNFNK